MFKKIYLKLAANILFHSRIRSWLTIIGIIIGVGAVVTIIAVSDSMAADMESRLADMDMTVITVTPGFTKAFSFGERHGRGPGEAGSGTSTSDVKLTDKDIRALKLMENVDYIYGSISGRETVSFMGKSADLSITGVDAQVWQYTVGYELASGRLLDPTDKYVAVIGHSIAEKVFDSPIGLNRIITINGKSIRVVGVLASGENDHAVIMPISAAIDVIDDAKNNEYSSIAIKVNDVSNVKTVAEEAEKKLLLSRHIINKKDQDFTIINSLSLAESMNAMLASVSIFLGAIAGISLLVGSVGIANTMFTSVMEKTREIGIMKAIGARNYDILMIFVINAALVGFIGGVLGVLLSFVLLEMMPLLGIQLSGASISSYLSPRLILAGISMAVCIGVISGAIPAFNASRMKPVDALRYE